MAENPQPLPVAQSAGKGFHIFGGLKELWRKLTDSRPKWLLVSTALLCALIVYARTASYEFVYDDLEQIVYNPAIKSWTLALSYFKTHVWAQSSNIALYYRPAFMLWLTANYKLFGLNPAYWHLAVVGLHLACCVLVYLFVRRLTRDSRITTVSTLLFALHPSHVESVAWISGATDPLLTVLFLGSLVCYLKHRDSHKVADGWYWVSLLLAALAMLTKETAIIIPLVILSYRWIYSERVVPGKSRFIPAVYAGIPYFLLSVLFVAARAFALKGLVPSTRAGIRSSFAAWPQVIQFYAAHGLFPVRMSVFYNVLSVTRLSLGNFALPLAIVSAVVAALYYASRRSKLWAFLSAWCAIMLIPMLNVTFWNSVENIHDRYLYLPSVAICMMIAIGLSTLKRLNFVGAMIATALMTIAYATMTTLELPYWQNEDVLAERGMWVSPGHPIAPQVKGNLLIREERTAEALAYLTDAMAAQPNNIDTLCSLSYCYADLNALSLAEEMITKALKVDSGEPRVHLLLGIVRTKQNRLNEAELEIRRALALQHLSAGMIMYHYYLGNVLDAKGDVQGAVCEYRLEAGNDPAIDPAARMALARINQIEKDASLQVR